MSNTHIKRPRVTHYGTAHIGNNIAYDCAVLEDGRRGYMMSTLQPAIGIRRKYRIAHFERFCAEIAPNALKHMNKSGSRFEVTMPHGGMGILPKLASACVVRLTKHME